MKRIFYIFMAVFMMIGITANSQTVNNDGVFSHMYIGINGGVNQTSVSDYSNWDNGFNAGMKSLTYNAGLELGKDVTPITGFSLQGAVAPIYHHVTNGSGEWAINRSDVFGNVKFNLMNLFGGYKGYPRRVDIRTVTGIGWNHWYGEEVANPNDLALQGGLEFDFNLGKNRNWYITFTPMVQANEILKGNEIEYAVKGADLKANLGVAYRLGRGNKSHNFTIPEPCVSEEDYNALFEKYNELLNAPKEVDTVEVIVEKIVNVADTTEKMPNELYVYFEKGSSELSDNDMSVIEYFVNNISEGHGVKVIGSADTKTGSESLNDKLSNQRAEVVANAIKNLGVKNVETETTFDINQVPEKSRCALIIVLD